MERITPRAPAPAVFIPEHIHAEARKWIQEYACIAVEPSSARNAEYAIIRNYRVDEALLNALPRLQLVIKHGAGVDNIDLSLLEARKIGWISTPGLNANGVAELAVSHSLRLLRTPATQTETRELSACRVTILGLGRIGTRVGQILSAGFGAKVRAYDPFTHEAPAGIELKGSLEEAVGGADVLFVTCPLTPETRDLVSSELLGRLAASAALVNTSRPAIVNNSAVTSALDSGQLRGYAHDFESEPEAFDAPPARGIVVSTPHLGGATEEALLRTGLESARHLIKALKVRS